ncbi:hypothetical protein GGR54DRAFT_616928 [Hypoxylon sp. NC1633]|nr:hypothetical protein GGR54DRAFT_616928 [Hypoxylon sp. NC1633]
MIDLLDAILLLLLAFIFFYRLSNIVICITSTPTTPIMINRRGGVRLPFRRTPLIRPPTPPPNASPTMTNLYEIGPEDILEVKDILSKTGNLPPELVDIILDRAEYWACATTIVDYSNQPRGRLSVPDSSEDQFLLRTEPLGLTKWSPSSQALWRDEPAPKLLQEEYPKSRFEELVEGPRFTLEHPFRKVVFDIVSCDQGYSNYGGDSDTYRNSWTWFDAGLERFDMNNQCPPECPDRQKSGTSNDVSDIPTCAIRSIWPQAGPVSQREGADMQLLHELHHTENHLIQRNKHADRNMQNHHVEWYWNDDIDPKSLEAETLSEMGRGTATANGEFVRNLKLGDMITVWGRARFPGWKNHIQRVQVKVYWAF